MPVDMSNSNLSLKMPRKPQADLDGLNILTLLRFALSYHPPTLGSENLYMAKQGSTLKLCSCGSKELSSPYSQSE